ncbi:MAG: cobalamin B12-binding domain-containing protein, partial [Candidatus Omnitrophica bacterium]|nr:cobalamin B12-binding domain-containing protein [Candidatus Omnitrophota bacterium]
MISQRKINRILLLRPVSETVFATGHPRDIRVPFSLKYIESLLEKEGIRQVRLIDCMAGHLDPERILSLASDFFPDAAVISPTTLEYELTLKISAALKEKNGCLN